MADEKAKTWYGEIEETITDTIKENHKRDITAGKLQGVLLDIVDLLKGKWLFGGVVQPSSQVDITGDVPVFYLAFTSGTYTNFGNNSVAEGEFALFMPNLSGNWDVHKWGIGTLLDGKVDKVEGKVLSENDYTNEDKGKVDSLPDNVAGKSGSTFTEGNFASFDENGNVVDSNNKAADFAPIEQAVPMGDEEDEGKILEKQSGGFGWVDKPVDGDDAYGVYEKEYKAEHSGSTDGMLTRPQWLASLKGEKGDNAVNPFKGIYGSSNKPTGTFALGDYIYAPTSASGQTGNTIWKWNGTTWQDSGETPDLANGETFASSETLQEVAIDDSHLVNPRNTADSTQPVLAQAEDVMQLKVKLGGATASEVKVNAVVGTNVTTGAYVSGETGLLVTPSSSASSYAYFELAIPQGTKSIRFATGTKTSNAKVGYSIGHYEENVYVPTRMFYFDVSGTTPPTGIVEKTIEVLEGETTFMATVAGVSTFLSITLDAFYCYLRSGETIVDFVNKNSVFNYVETNALPNLMQADYVNFVIYQSGKWGQSTFSDNYTRSAIIPIKEGDVLTIESLYHQNSFAFLSDYPSNPVVGEYAPVIGSTYLIGPNNEYKKRVLTAPAGSKYLAVKLLESSQDWRPSSISINTKVPAKIDSYLTDENYDTYIEEDIFRYDSGPTVNGLKKKIYKRDNSVDYKLIIHIPDTADSTVHYLDGNFELISDAFGFGSASDYETGVIVTDNSYRGRLLRMESMDIPADCEYIQVDVRTWQETGKSTTYGLGALMKPLKEDGTMPQNELIYCVSRVKRPLIPNGYDEEGTYQPDGYVWSPWAFMFPYGANSITGKKYPIATYFHGGTGIVTSECFGYNSGLKQWPIVSMLRSRGCIVFDINGYGIHPKQGYVTSHQGCPTALHTIKKAYETIVNRFNGRRGMVLSGISMGGQTAKGYAMTYPQDCIALALAAPGEIALNMRVSDNSETFKCVYYGWEYGSKEAIDADTKREKFIGYSPLVKPNIIQDDGTLKNMNEAMDYTAAQMFSNIDKFSAPFPCEIKIWHGENDITVLPRNSILFVNTVRNAGCNASLRICPNCNHEFTDLLWVRQEIVDYIIDKLSI